MPTEQKKQWITDEYRAGVREIEVCSFIPVKLIPQFADAAEIVAHALTLDGLTVAALVPNLKGAQRGLELGVHKMNYVISVSESHNRANVRRSTEESAADFEQIVALCKAQGARRPKIVGGLSTALGCSIEGRVPQENVRRLATRLAEAGADEIILADTVGYADPASVRQLFSAVKRDLGDAMLITAHFHDTRGLGLANALAALDVGVRAFDASLGGLGGCPYAPGASGNIATEDLVFMLESMGLTTGVDLEQLLAVRAQVREALADQPFHGAIARAGLPKHFSGQSRISSV
jgi:hydroxymethylglutaryl-CoA lyase